MTKWNPFTWFKHKPDQTLVDLGNAIAHAESAKPSVDVEFDKLLNVNKFLADDSFLDTYKEEQSYNLYPKIDENGDYITDNDGTIEYYKIPNPKALAKRELTSHKHAVRFRSQKSANLAKIKVEELFTLIQMDEPETPNYLANSILNKAIELDVHGALDDSIMGRKAKLMKIAMKATTVGVREPSKRSEEDIF